MGYSHYWQHKAITDGAWAALVADARRIIEAAKVPLAGWDGTGEPVLNEHEIGFNGVEPDDYETFLLAPEPTDLLLHAFCKTGMRPYDLVVTAVLLRAALTIPKFKIKSNGTWEEWRPTRDLYAAVFGSAPEASPLAAEF